METPSPLTALLCALLRSPGVGLCGGSEQSRHLLLRHVATRELNAFLWLSLIAVTALLSASVLKILRLWRRARRIAGPPCPSFYGHCELVSRGRLTDILSESHEKYGSVVKLWLGPTQLLVSIKDPKLVQSLTFKAADKLPLITRAYNLPYGRSSLFASSFNETELSKKMLNRENQIAKNVVECIMERIHESMAKGCVDCKLFSQHVAFSVLGTSLFGEACLKWSEGNVFEELLVMIAEDACLWASYHVTPFWKPEYWNYRRLCTKLKHLTQDMVQHCRKNEKLKTGEKHVDVHMVNEPFLSGVNCGFVEIEEDLTSSVMGIMFHGCLTTSGLINAILMRLVNHPELQNKICIEISIAKKDSKTPAYQHVHKMPLLLATVYEAARLLPAGPLLQRCSLNHDLNLDGDVTVPAGAVVVVPVELVQKDGSSWGNDACEFNPHRFLSISENKADLGENSFVSNDPNDNAAFLPFGSGIRSCVGQNFVFQVVAELLASLLNDFEIKPRQNNQEPKVTKFRSELLPSTEIAFLRRNQS